MPGINEDGSELSAQFIFDIISIFNVEEFFNHVYLTNISWFGFIKDGNNFNYYNLDSSLIEELTYGFIEEMRIVEPKAIIPLSKEVEKTLKKMKDKYNLQYELGPRIPHPYYYSNFPSRYSTGIEKYCNIIKEYMRKD